MDITNHHTAGPLSFRHFIDRYNIPESVGDVCYSFHPSVCSVSLFLHLDFDSACLS